MWGVSQGPAATLCVVTKTLAHQIIPDDLARVHFHVEFVCPILPFVMPSWMKQSVGARLHLRSMRGRRVSEAGRGEKVRQGVTECGRE